MKNKNDTKGKLFGVFNVIDVAVLLLVVALVFAFVFRSGIVERVTLSNSDTVIEATFCLSRIAPGNADTFQVGQPLVDGETGAVLGTIITADVTDAFDYVKLSDGTVTKMTTPGYVELKVAIRGSGTESAAGFLLNGTRYVAPGAIIPISSVRSSGNAVVLAVSGYQK